MAKVKTPKTKKCNECELRKPANAFGQHKNGKDGLWPTCKKCRTERKAKPKAKRKLSPAQKVALANSMVLGTGEHPLASSLRKLYKKGVRRVEFDDKGVAKLELVQTMTVRGL